MSIYFALGIGIIGLVIGSFLTAFTHRYPRRIQIAKGRSFCPNCKRKISWYDNLPVISYIILGGRCRHCKRRISLRYPLIEAFSAAGFAGAYILSTKCNSYFKHVSPICSNFKNTGAIFILSLIIFSLALAIFVIDLEHKIIPDSLSFLGLGVVFAFLLLFSQGEIYSFLLAGFLAALFLLLVNLITKGRGMGLGDVKFALFAGVFLGAPSVLVFLFVAFLTGAILGSILILVRKAKFGQKIAFGPFLVLSLVITATFGFELLRWIYP